MNSKRCSYLVLAAATALAGCAGGVKIDPTAGGGGLTGAWQPDGGGYTARFDNGSFSTIAADTGGLISQGSYIVQSESQVQLQWKSNITGLDNSAQCERPDPNVMECRDAGGRTFVLRRSTA